MRHLQPEMGAAEPWWLELELFGFEEDDEDEEEDDDLDDEDEDDLDDDEEDDYNLRDEDDEDEEDEEDEDEANKKDAKTKSKKKNTAGLVKALRRERMGRKRSDREVRRLKAQLREARQSQKSKKPTSKAGTKSGQGNGSKDDDAEEQETQDTGPSEREIRLAARLRDAAIDQVILAAATRAKFLDPEDAVRLIDRKDIEFDQDEDDPTDIEIDRESVDDAVKELARKKKHLLNRGGSGQGRTGSRVGSRRSKGELNDDALRQKFGLGARRT